MFSSKDIFLTSPSGGYTIARSVRLRSSASAYFNRTPASAGNQRTFTISAWVKRGKLGAFQQILRAYDGSSAYAGTLQFTSSDTLEFTSGGAAGYTCDLITTAVYRDPSAWYHIVLAFDSTQATSTNRTLMYVNGVQVTSFGTATYSAQNNLSTINTTNQHQIGGNTSYFDGYLTEINFVDGQALTPSSFGSTNSITGVWQPAKYTGTYGTNGFYLNFSDNSAATAAAIGKDYSGNGNNWTPNNISVTAGVTYDSMLDTPTMYADGGNGRGNYATGNPLKTPTQLTVSNANMTVAASGASINGNLFSTIGVSSGKWYFEATVSTNTSSNAIVGVGSAAASANAYLGSDANGWAVAPSAGTLYYYYNGVTNTLAVSGLTATGTFGVAFDADAGKMWVTDQTGSFTAVNSGNPTSGTNPLFSSLVATNNLFASIGHSSVGSQTTQTSANYGQRPFTYTPPTGFVALNTQNLPTPTISNGANYMAATTYSGNYVTNETQSVSNAVNGVSFQPDFVWIKCRNVAVDHALFNSVGGATKYLSSNTTTAETTDSTSLTSFNSNGFTVGAQVFLNNSGRTYVGWQWKAGGTSSSNTNGSITSTVSVGATQGFSVCTYTAPASSQANSFGHGLGVAPSMVIAKNRSSGTGGLGWAVYHTSLGANQYLSLNSTAAASTVAGYWGSGMTSTVVGLPTAASSTGYDNCTGNMVAYCFAAVKGFSAFGSYTGNGSTDGPFVFTNFQPRWLMVKRTDTAGFDWVIIDTARDPVNVMGNDLYANSSSAEVAGVNRYDFLSNGFKVRTVGNNFNASGGTYIYASFASNPFKQSLAR